MKKVVALFVLILLPFTMMGQSVSKQINDIKRNSQYLSAEATLETEADAYEMASELLDKEIGAYIQGNSSLQKSEVISYKNVRQKTEKIQMKRGTMIRVFLYVNTNDLTDAENVPMVENDSSYASAVDKVLKDVENNQDIGLVDTVVIDSDLLNDDEEEEKLIATMSDYPSWQQGVIYTLLGGSSLKQVLYLIDRFKVELKVKRSGVAANCRNPEKCYWIIFDDSQHVIAVLGPGTEERTNFATLEMDSLKNYSGKGALWFTLSN